MTEQHTQTEARDTRDNALLAEQVRQIYRNAPVGWIATTINSVALTFVLRSLISPAVLISWLACIFLVTLGRLILQSRYQQTPPGSCDPRPWARRFVIGTALSGVVWGSAGIVLFPAESVVHQTFLVFVLGGMAAGAAATYAILWPAFAAYCVPALLPVVVRLLSLGGEVSIAMGGMLLLFGALLLVVARQVHALTTLSLRLRFENDDLIANLTSSVAQSEGLNRELHQHRERLQELVNERTAELSRVNAQLLQEVEERKKAEDAVRRNAAYFQSLIANALDITTVLDGAGRVLYESPSVRQLGYTDTELLGADVFSLIHPEDLDAARAALSRAIERPDTTEMLELRIRHRDGSWRVLEAAGKSFTDESGARNIIVNSRDVTERRKLEEQLQRIQRIESLGVFAGGLAHDLNNILTGILGNIELAAMYLEPAGKSAARLEQARRASLRARELTNQLLTFSKGGTPVKKPLALGALLENAVAFVLSGSSVAAELAVPENLWHVDADEGQLSQVFHNILLNAVQAMPGGGTIFVRCENIPNGSVTAPDLRPEQAIHIAIEDQGVGIPEEYLDKIFDPYFSTKQPGSGLGLAISYSIVKKHGGHITVESRPGRGTVLHVYLPASNNALPVHAAAEERPLRGTGRVLLMDDEEVVLDVAGEALRNFGYDVTFAPDGAGALSLYAAAREAGQPFDAVILDLTIPGGMGGKETVQKLLALDPRARVIVASGYSDDPILSDFREYGFAAALRKPFRIRDLGEVVKKVLTES